jgi:hypothetical protein
MFLIVFWSLFLKSIEVTYDVFMSKGIASSIRISAPCKNKIHLLIHSYNHKILTPLGDPGNCFQHQADRSQQEYLVTSKQKRDQFQRPEGESLNARHQPPI